MADDPYKTLGVARDASDEDIRRAFRKLAKELHPDLNPADKTRAEERFKRVTAAYEIVGDSAKRKQFDRGEIDASGEPRRPQPQWRHPGGPRPGAARGGRSEAEDFGFSDIFSDMFGGRGPAGARGAPRTRGQDVRYTLDVDFLEAATGATKRVTLPEGGMLDITLPAGVADGQSLRLRGKGGPPLAAGAEAGDALVEIRVRPHPHMKRVGDDILLELPITIDEAVLGAKVEVATIGGRVQLTLPKGTSSGQVFRLKGKGLKSLTSGTSGDQLVTVKIVLPDVIDDALSYFFSEWRQKNGYDPGRKL